MRGRARHTTPNSISPNDICLRHPRPYVDLSIVAVIVVHLAILKTQFVSASVFQLRSDALPTLLGPSRLRGELIDQLVHRVPRVALHPPERDATLPHDLDKRLPQVSINDRPFPTVGPVFLEPALPPAIPEAVDDVRRVAHHLKRTV
jgi:hypothetical protein